MLHWLKQEIDQWVHHGGSIQRSRMHSTQCKSWVYCLRNIYSRNRPSSVSVKCFQLSMDQILKQHSISLAYHHELAEMKARPESSTPNKNPGIMLKKDTPRPCPKPAGNLLSESAEYRSPEYIYVTNEELSENKAIQQTVSGFPFKDNDSKSSTPDILVRVKTKTSVVTRGS